MPKLSEAQDLKLKCGKEIHVNLIIYIQFIIGDTKGHDHLCGRMGSYQLGMKQLCRECDVSPDKSDNVEHKCSFRKLNEVKALKSNNEFKDISFYEVENAMYDLDFGDDIRGVFGATNGEPLHILEMQLLEIITEGFIDTLPTSSKHILH